jgi:hypothetical protein
MDNEKIVFVGQYPDSQQKSSLLESSGIPCRINAALHSGLMNAVSLNSIGPAEVLVPVGYYDQAIEILSIELQSINTHGDWICSKCKEEVEGHFDLCWNCQNPR